MKNKLIALAASVLFSASVMANDFVISTGSEGGGYHKQGVKIAHAINAEQLKQNKKLKKKGKEQLRLDVEVVTSNGSLENLSGFNDGSFQAIKVQVDALNLDKPAFKYKVRTGASEPVLWIFNRDLGFANLDQVEGRKDLAIVIVEGSGGNVTFNSFVQEDADYGNNPTIEALDFEDALDIVAEGEYEGVKVAGMIHVANSLSNEVVQDYNRFVAVGEATDGDFDDAKDVEGNKLYEQCVINIKKMGGLNSANRFADLDTVCVRSALVWNIQDLSRMEQKVIQRAARSVYAK